MTDRQLLATINDVYVYTAPISVSADISRRQAERRTVCGIVADLFGDEAEYCHEPSGAPYVKGFADKVTVSVSHCADTCVVAVSPHNRFIGVDVELWREQLLRVAPRFLTPREMPVCSVSPLLLLKAWTAKEAVFKASNQADLTISQIEVDFDREVALARIVGEGGPAVASGRCFDVHFIGEFPRMVALALHH